MPGVPKYVFLQYRDLAYVIDGGRGERPSSPKCDGGASTARSSGPRSPVVAIACHARACPLDPIPVPATDAVALLFLPPALSLVHLALYLPASILVLLTPAKNSESHLAAPPPSSPDGDIDANIKLSFVATMDPLPEDTRLRATQSVLSLSPPPRTGGGGGAQNTAPCPSRDRAAACSGTSARSSLVVVIVIGVGGGGAPAATVAGMAAAAESREAAAAVLWDVVVCMYVVVLVFLVVVRLLGMNGSFYLNARKLYKFACKFHASSVQVPCTCNAKALHVFVQRFCIARAYGGIRQFHTECTRVA